MKTVWAILFLVSVVWLSGCRSTPRDTSDRAGRPAATTSARTYWDSDLRPALTVSSPRSRVEPAPGSEPETASAPAPALAADEPQKAPKEKEPVAKAPVEEVKAPPMVPAEPTVPTAEPIHATSVAEARGFNSDRVTPIGGRMMTMDETGGRILSIRYPRPDLSIVQVDKTMPEEVRVNSAFSYLIKVTNLTDTMLSDLTITETVSKDFEFKGSEPPAQAEGGKLVWVINSLGPKASMNIKISGVATNSKSLEQATSITHTVRDTAVVKVVEPALELKKIAPADALLCEPILVEYVVTNTGTGAAQNVQVLDNLAAGMQTVDGKAKVALDAGTLAAGESRRFSVKLRVSKTGVFAGKATAISASGLKVESESVSTTVRQPVLTVTKSGPKHQYLGRSVTYEITVFNKGDGPAQTTIVEDVIPPGVTNIEATTGAQFSGSKLIWELGTLEPNTSKKVKVSYTPSKEGELMASVTASAYCAEPVTDSAKTAITGIATTRLEVIDEVDPVEVGTNTTYVITTTNEGSAADSNIRIICQLDDKLQYVSSAGATAGSLIGKTVSFAPLRSLEPKTKATWRVIVKGQQSGDVRFKVTMHTDEIALPVEQMEVTHIYRQNGGN